MTKRPEWPISFSIFILFHLISFDRTGGCGPKQLRKEPRGTDFLMLLSWMLPLTPSSSSPLFPSNNRCFSFKRWVFPSEHKMLAMFTDMFVVGFLLGGPISDSLSWKQLPGHSRNISFALLRRSIGRSVGRSYGRLCTAAIQILIRTSLTAPSLVFLVALHHFLVRLLLMFPLFSTTAAAAVVVSVVAIVLIVVIIMARPVLQPFVRHNRHHFECVHTTD